MDSCWQNLQQKARKLLAESLYILTINLLNLLIPLSFILLSRISCAQYYKEQHSSFFFSLILYTNPALLYTLISTVTIATFVQNLTGKKLADTRKQSGKICHLHLYTAWVIICTLQVCVGLGLEGSIAAGVEGGATGFGGSIERSLVISRVMFFLGLHETMVVWFRMVVKPVVDDTCSGGGGVMMMKKEEEEEEERWVDRIAMAVSCGGLWWWKLRDEVESLVIVADVKKTMHMNVGVSDFVGWWLYYVTVTIGMVRVFKGLFLIFRSLRRNDACDFCDDDDDDKV